MKRTSLLQGALDPIEPAALSASPKIGSKRANATYKQFSAYIPEDKYRRLKAKIAMEGRDLSNVMEELVDKWLGE